MKPLHYEVWVASAQYHKDAPLTYSSEEKLAIGTVVIVPMQRQTVVAVVVRQVGRPRFTTKPIRRVVSSAPVPPESIKLLDWLRTYYPAPSGQIASLLLPGSLVSQSRQPKEVPAQAPAKTLPPLTSDQQKAVKIIQQATPKSVLLHGDTGTGKTRVYLELTKQSLEKGKSVLLLTPEIGLTPQLALVAAAAFPDKTIVIHSEFTPAQRRDAWLRILESPEPLIVIGPRSALFTPLKNIGLVVMDECHETTYKQEQAPHYLASRVAAKLASLHGAQLILGSATPPIQDYYTFQQKGLPIVRLREQAIPNKAPTAPVIITDLKDRKAFRHSAWISNDLLNALKEALHSKQQSLLFLNRRGTARLILCQNCGWEDHCPRCDLPLTYHGDRHAMECHTCGFTDTVPTACPTCSANDIIFRTIGTKALVAELERLLPEARIQRFDSDTKKADRLSTQYQAIHDGQVDILVGTQMLGKGLDLPKLSTLGIVLADTSLTFPDYTAEERTFQLLTQVMGRVNRGHVPGKVFVQTYHPESPLLLASISKDYEQFYQQQITERQQYGFPPFRYILKISCARATSASAKKASQKLVQDIRDSSARVEVIGPSPAFVEKTNDRYRWQLIVKAADRSELLKIIPTLPANFTYDIDPINLL